MLRRIVVSAAIGLAIAAPAMAETLIVKSSGKELVLEVKLSDTVAAVKKVIADKQGGEVAALIHGGKVMEDGKKLLDYGFGSVTTVMMVPKF
jgi:hypothetical protein